MTTQYPCLIPLQLDLVDNHAAVLYGFKANCVGAGLKGDIPGQCLPVDAIASRVWKEEAIEDDLAVYAEFHMAALGAGFLPAVAYRQRKIFRAAIVFPIPFGKCAAIVSEVEVSLAVVAFAVA